MRRFIHIARKVVAGEVHHVEDHARGSPVSAERIREAFDELASEGVLYHVYGGYYVTAELDGEEKEEAITRLRELGAELSNETDDTTTVTVSGALMEDATFETDAGPTEVVK